MGKTWENDSGLVDFPSDLVYQGVHVMSHEGAIKKHKYATGWIQTELASRRYGVPYH